MPADDGPQIFNGDPGPRSLVENALRLTFDGAVRGVAFAGVEVLRRIDHPIRDADWRTLAIEEVEARVGPGLRLHRRFRTADGVFEGTFTLGGGAGETDGWLAVEVALSALRDAEVNRAGFVLLHPIAGVAGEPLEVVRPDGSVAEARFPDRISPSQPVFDIAGLRHRVGPVAVEIAMEGEVFEMEDQRNWTDASFKTYCRPLARPRPFAVTAGETLRQRIRLRFALMGAPAPAPVAAPARATMPAIALAHEPALGGATHAAARLDVGAVLVRVDAAAPVVETGGVRAPVTLEIVAEDEAGIGRVKAACAAAGLPPQRVVGVPRAYLASHQPQGPWPDGAAPDDLVPMLRAAFPEAEVGGGMLTNFTEFNRRPPDPAAVDFATFGTTAIVHAADDASVLETLEALGDVFVSARALARGRPLRLGLLSIGMRSNPYGAAVAANPEGRRIAMAMDDPRQRTRFAAAWAVGAAAAAARAGVASYAPAMTGGPLGMGGDGDLWPIYHAVAALAALSGVEVEAAGGPSAGLVTLLGRGERGVAGVVANLGPEPARFEAPEGTLLRLLRDGAGPDWIDGPGETRAAALLPFDMAALKGAGA